MSLVVSEALRQEYLSVEIATGTRMDVDQAELKH